MELDDGIEELIALTEFSDTEDTDSIVAPSKISFFTDSEDEDMTGAISSDSEVHTMQQQAANLVNASSDDQLTMSTSEMSETDLDPVDFIYSHQQEENNTLLQSDSTQAPVNTLSSSTSHSSNTQLDLHPCGFTVVGDNIDKNFRPSYQRQDRQTKPLHYFHAYAAMNHVDVSSLSDARPPAILSAESFLPTQSDLNKLLQDFKILISR